MESETIRPIPNQSDDVRNNPMESKTVRIFGVRPEFDRIRPESVRIDFFGLFLAVGKILEINELIRKTHFRTTFSSIRIKNLIY